MESLNNIEQEKTDRLLKCAYGALEMANQIIKSSLEKDINGREEKESSAKGIFTEETRAKILGRTETLEIIEAEEDEQEETGR